MLETFLIVIARVIVPVAFAFLTVAFLLVVTGAMDTVVENAVQLQNLQAVSL